MNDRLERLTRKALNAAQPTERLSKRRRLYDINGLHISGAWEKKKDRKPYFRIEEIYNPAFCIPVSVGNQVRWIAAVKREKGGGTGRVYEVLPSGAIIVTYKLLAGSMILTRKVWLAPWQVVENLTTGEKHA